MKLYSTIMEETSAEQVIERSRFICRMIPVETREEAEEFFRETRKKYRDATHNVPAMVIGDKFQVQWASDDGEPQGTSGAPIVQMLVSEGITNVALVVTRYFGGIKLGTGGLVRAYTSTVKLALNEGRICDVEEVLKLSYATDYKSFNKVQGADLGPDMHLEDIEYMENVSFSIVTSPENREKAVAMMDGLTNGAAALKNENIGTGKVLKTC